MVIHMRVKWNKYEQNLVELDLEPEEWVGSFQFRNGEMNNSGITKYKYVCVHVQAFLCAHVCTYMNAYVFWWYQQTGAHHFNMG